MQQLKSVPCLDCGKVYPWYVMDLAHLDPSTKKWNIRRKGVDWKSSTLTQIRTEFEKGDVVCSNCHRIREFHHLEDTRPGDARS